MTLKSASKNWNLPHNKYNYPHMPVEQRSKFSSLLVGSRQRTRSSQNHTRTQSNLRKEMTYSLQSSHNHQDNPRNKSNQSKNAQNCSKNHI